MHPGLVVPTSLVDITRRWNAEVRMNETNDPPRRSDGILYRRRERLDWHSDQPFRILSLDGGGIRGFSRRQYSRSWRAHTSVVVQWPNISI